MVNCVDGSVGVVPVAELMIGLWYERSQKGAAKNESNNSKVVENPEQDC